MITRHLPFLISLLCIFLSGVHSFTYNISFHVTLPNTLNRPEYKLFNLNANTFSAINVVITCNFVADYLYLTDSEYGRLEMNETVTPIANLTDVLPKSQVYLSIGDKEKPLKEVYQSAFIHFLAVVCYCC
jgi:hypothetical protein